MPKIKNSCVLFCMLMMLSAAGCVGSHRKANPIHFAAKTDTNLTCDEIGIKIARNMKKAGELKAKYDSDQSIALLTLPISIPLAIVTAPIMKPPTEPEEGKAHQKRAVYLWNLAEKQGCDTSPYHSVTGLWACGKSEHAKIRAEQGSCVLPPGAEEWNFDDGSYF